MAWFLGQSLLFIVLAFVLGLLVGWLIWGRRRVVQLSFSGGLGSSSASSSGAVAAGVPAPASAPGIESEPLDEPVLAGAGGSSSSMVDISSDSTVDFGALSDVDERELEPALAGVAVSSAAGSVAEPVADRVFEVEPQPVTVATSSAAFESERLESEPLEPEPLEPELLESELLEPEPVAESVAELEPAASVEAGAPAVAAAAGPDDDLKRIEGIGPKMSAALQTAGIRTFRQLSAADDTSLRAAIEAAGLRFAPSLVTWARQAKLLADGNEDGFNALTKQLIAGREARRD